jgi:uncharacterized membrane protein YdbT with pleckstrin-like domain
MAEKFLWKDGPSQVVNLFWFICVLLILYYVDNYYIKGIAALFAIWEYLVIKNIEYTLTDERIILSTGVLSKTVQNLEIFRVKDIRLDRPFFLRIFHLSTLFIVSSDQTNKFIRLRAIKNGQEIMEQIRTLSEERREIKGVKEFDVSHLYPI